MPDSLLAFDWCTLHNPCARPAVSAAPCLSRIRKPNVFSPWAAWPRNAMEDYSVSKAGGGASTCRRRFLTLHVGSIASSPRRSRRASIIDHFFFLLLHAQFLVAFSCIWTLVLSLSFIIADNSLHHGCDSSPRSRMTIMVVRDVDVNALHLQG